MRHVFVETNWVVAFAAPAHQQVQAAADLVNRAREGEVRLYVPSVCLSEARHPLRTKFQPRSAAGAVRKYLGWAEKAGKLEALKAETVRSVLDQFESTVLAELDELENRLEQLPRLQGVEVFPLTEAMLGRAVELSALNLDLKPFDQAILAAVLVRAEALRDQGETDVVFCELDSDLQPWNKEGQRKRPLADLFDSAHLWVYGDFSMTSPERQWTGPVTG